MRINRHIRQSHYISIAASISAVILLGVSFFVINPVSNKTKEASATTGTATASTTTLALSTTNNSASVDITANNTSGTFATSDTTGIASFTASTNNYSGYTLSIVANDDTGTLATTVEPGDTPETISSIASITTTTDFKSSSSTSLNGKWGIKPSRYVTTEGGVTTNIDNTGDNAVYLPSPTTTPTILSKTTTANSIDNNISNADTYTLGLGIRVDGDTKAGTYTKNVTLTTLANPSPYTINYNKNTTETVTNMPATSTSGSASDTTITLANTVPARDHYSFLGWCSTTTTSSNGVDSCSGTIYNPNGNGTNLTYGIDQTTANTTTLYAMWKIDTFTCTKQYRLENADGTWGNYTTEATETVSYGGTCSYSKTIADYRGGSSAANNTQGSTSASNIIADTTVSLDFYRNTYTLTVSAGTNTSSPTGSGTYRWGQSVTIGVTKSTNVTCTSYATPTWTATAGTAPNAGASSSYTMPSSDATVTATSTASNVAQTITLSRSGGASGITIAGTSYTASSVSLNCGTYNISGSYSNGYEFSSWSRANNVTVANTAAASTTMTVSGPGTLTLTGKQSKLFFQNATSAQCGQIMYDNRGTSAYKDIAYTTASINGLCWMTRNLDLPGGTTLTSADSNVSAGCSLGGTNNCTLPASSTSGFSDASTAYVYNSGSTTCGDGSPCYSYYSYAAATAGTNPSSGNATSDICPKGWRLPTQAEYNTLASTYTTGATLTAAPFNGVYAGYYSRGSFVYGGSSGIYWSSTAYNASRAYNLYFDSSYADVNVGNKYLGLSIRCVTP